MVTNRWSLLVFKPVDLFKSLVKTQPLEEQNFTLITTLYNPSTRCTEGGIIHFKKTSMVRMNLAISKQKLTFILAGYRDVLRISLFADYEQIFNEGLQPQDKLNIISFACKVALWSDPNVTAEALEKTYQSKHIISELKRGFVNKLNLIKHSYFLPRNSTLVLYFKVILPSVRYALPIWGCFTNKNEFNSLKSIHCRTARVI